MIESIKNPSNILEITKKEQKFIEYKFIKKKRSTLLKSEKAYQINILKEINYSMIMLGFNIENLYFLHYKFKYKNLDEAISLISKNEGFYNHDFFDINELDEFVGINNMKQSCIKISPNNNSKFGGTFIHTYDSLTNSSSMLNSKYFRNKYDEHCLICNDKRYFHLNINSKVYGKKKNNEKQENIQNPMTPQEDRLDNVNNNNENNTNTQNVELNAFGKLKNNYSLAEFIKSKKQVNNCSFEHLKDMQYDTNKQVLAYLQQTYTHERPKERDCTICYKNHGLPDFCHCDKKCCFKCLKEYYLDYLQKEKEYEVDEVPCLFNCGYNINEFLKAEILESLTPEDNKKLRGLNKISHHIDSNFNYYNTGAIPCIFENCIHLVYYNELTTKFVECESGHKFCARCKHPWHLNMDCISFFNNPIFTKSNLVRMCPNCGLLIMREKNSYTIKCSCCFYQFCFFCLDQVEENHFSLYNLQGCGWKKENKVRYDSFDNENNNSYGSFQKCLGFLCWIIFNTFYLLFFLLLGCCYEFITMFNEYLNAQEDKAMQNKSVLSEMNMHLEGEDALELRPKQKITQYFYYLYFLFVTFFIICGICCQPIYIIYKLLDKLLDFIKFYGLNDSDHRD